MVSLFLFAAPLIGEPGGYSDVNRLRESDSPYLLQHAGNPVHWLPWGEEAFDEARRLNRPVLVSIGYSTCHWCHVMEDESFEDPATAELMNELLINIKVDREQLPGVDSFYMEAAALMGASTGWPLNVFLDQDGKPFFAGTYFPNQSWKNLIRRVDELWRTRRDRLEETGRALTDAIHRDSQMMAGPRWAGSYTPEETAILHSRYLSALSSRFDTEYPGFPSPGGPQFPPTAILSFLLEYRDEKGREMAERVLETMQDSGIHDRVGGGFHRYATDRAWRLPHFEKMLYDNAQLMGLYARGAVLFERDDFLETAENIGDYLLRDMRLTDKAGRFIGYATAEDADDPAGEGAFYAWSPRAVRELLPEREAEELVRVWDLRSHDGAVSGEPVSGWIPYPLGGAGGEADVDMAALRLILLTARSARPRPGRDDKVLTGLNGLVLEGFSQLARSSGEGRFARAVEELADHLLRRNRRFGVTRGEGIPPYITDFAFLILGLTAAYPLMEDPRLVEAAREAAAEAVEALAAPGGAFFSSPEDSLNLPVRKVDPFDSQIPSGQSALALGFARLYGITGDDTWKGRAEGIIGSQRRHLESYSTAYSTLLRANLLLGRGWHIVLAGDAGEEVYGVLKEQLLRTVGGYSIVTALGEGSGAWRFLEGRRRLTVPQILICSDDSCLLPVYSVEELTGRLKEAGILE